MATDNTPVTFWVSPDMRTMLQEAANSETNGNLSELCRQRVLDEDRGPTSRLRRLEDSVAKVEDHVNHIIEAMGL